MRRALLTNETLNSKGFKILVSGIDLTRFMKNPVMFYEHQNSGVTEAIGRWRDVKVEADKITAIPEFDLNSSTAVELKRRWDEGFLTGVSIGALPIEIDEATSPVTWIKTELIEASLVEVPSNPDALQLTRKVNLTYIQTKNKNEKMSKENTSVLMTMANTIQNLCAKLSVKEEEPAKLSLTLNGANGEVVVAPDLDENENVAEGTKVVVDGSDTWSGDLTLADGTMIKVESGTVTAVAQPENTEAESAETENTETNSEELTDEQTVTETAELKAELSAMAKVVQGLTQLSTSMITELETLKKHTKSGYVPNSSSGNLSARPTDLKETFKQKIQKLKLN